MATAALASDPASVTDIAAMVARTSVGAAMVMDGDTVAATAVGMATVMGMDAAGATRAPSAEVATGLRRKNTSEQALRGVAS